MSDECDKCGEHCLDCGCYARDALKPLRANPRKDLQYRVSHLNGEPVPLSNDNLDPPPVKLPEPTWVNVRGREEHEEMLRDSNKMWSLGLDPAYEIIVYLRRWGSWLNGSVSYDGKL